MQALVILMPGKFTRYPQQANGLDLFRQHARSGLQRPDNDMTFLGPC